MRQQIVIETDSEMGTVFAYAVSMDYTDKVNYRREASDKPLLCRVLGPKFYGELDALLVTADKIKDAAPITPEPLKLSDVLAVTVTDCQP